MSRCQPYRDALSALQDGEVAPVGHEALQAHLDGCGTCTAFAAASDDLARRLRVVPAEPVPDVTASVLAAVDTPAVARARARFGQLRVLLAMVGVAQLVLAVGALLGAGHLAVHATREAGIFELALGVGFLVVAARPARASGLLPVAAVVAALATLTSLGDVAAGTTSLVQESAHVLELVGTGLLWGVDRHLGRPGALRPSTA